MYRRVSFPAPALGCVCPNQDISSQSLIRIITNPLPSVSSPSNPPVVSRSQTPRQVLQGISTPGHQIRISASTESPIVYTSALKTAACHVESGKSRASAGRKKKEYVQKR